MYDSTNADSIPVAPPGLGALMAGYVNGSWQSYLPMCQRFPLARVLSITISSGVRADIIDCETGDATPSSAAQHFTAGLSPVIYCNSSTWPSVQQAVAALTTRIPQYWIAQYDNNPYIPQAWMLAGCVAKQYQSTPGYDESSTIPGWPVPLGGLEMNAPSAVVNPASGNIEYGYFDASGNLWIMGITKEGTWGTAFNVTKQCGAPVAG